MVEKKKALKEEEKEVVSNETEKIDIKKESAVSEELPDEILKKIEKMTVLELADLVKALEKKFGVTAAMPVGMPSNAAGAVATGEDNKVEEKTNFKVILKEIDIIACTEFPGLMPSLLVGMSVAKTLAKTLEKPYIAIDHIEAHMFANFI